MANKTVNTILIIVIVILVIWVIWLAFKKSGSQSEAFRPQQEMRLIRVGTPTMKQPVQKETFNVAHMPDGEMHTGNMYGDVLHARPFDAAYMGAAPIGAGPVGSGPLAAEHDGRLGSIGNVLGEELHNRMRMNAASRTATGTATMPDGATYGADMPQYGLPGAGMARSDMQRYGTPGSDMIASENNGPFDFGRPYVDSATGSLFQGPGYEPSQLRNILGEEVGPVPADFFMIDDGAAGNMNIANNLCSKSCCSPQWPTPFKLREDPFLCSAKRSGELVPSQYFCNNAFQDAGCLCMTKQQSSFLTARGGNGPSLF